MNSSVASEEALSPTLVNLRRMLMPLKGYHRYRAEGLEHVPRSGPVLMVVSHSLATYDAFLLGMAIHDATGRLPRGLGDDLIFKTPWLADRAYEVGIRPASPKAGHQILEEGHLLGVAPGGMREALRPADERYRVRWSSRKGFIRLALETGAPILLAACAGADDVYTVYESRLTKLSYKYLKVPVPVIRGWGPTLLPRPVSLVHHIAPVIQPPPLEADRFEEQVDELHAQVVKEMNRLMSLR